MAGIKLFNPVGSLPTSQFGLRRSDRTLMNELTSPGRVKTIVVHPVKVAVKPVRIIPIKTAGGGTALRAVKPKF